MTTPLARSSVPARLTAAVLVATGLLIALVAPTPASAGGVAGEISLVSHTPVSPATAPIGISSSPSVSADGAYVAFASGATNLVEGQEDYNGKDDVFLYERATGTVKLVSHGNHFPAVGTQDGASTNPSISANGAYVVFESTSADIPGNGKRVVLYERATGHLRSISRPNYGTLDGSSHSASISADGQFVAFQSSARNIDAVYPDTNQHASDIFVYDTTTDEITLVSNSSSWSWTANGASYSPLVSADGSFVAYTSVATDQVEPQTDSNGAGEDVFLYEIDSGKTELVSHVPVSSATTANRGSRAVSISGDGSLVLLSSAADDLVTGMTDANSSSNPDLFLYERTTGALTLVSHTATSTTTTANEGSFTGSLSVDGSTVAFRSAATDLIAGQTGAEGASNVFTYDRATAAVTLVSHPWGNSTAGGNADSYLPSLSANGSIVAFVSRATDLVASLTEGNAGGDIYLWERATGASTLVSHAAASPTTTGNSYSYAPSVDSTGKWVAFISPATNLVTGQADANGAFDVFLYRRLPTYLVGETGGRRP